MDELKASTSQSPGRGTVQPIEELTLSFLEPCDDPTRLGRLGPYEVTDVIGRGGFGVVFKAFDPSLGRFVAIKVLAPYLASNVAARQRFAREGRAAAAVSHQHVVAIHSVNECNGLPYLVMEYVAGISLQERLDKSGPLDLKEILRIGMQTAAGLAAAHAQGLVHRDIKPANILLEHGVERVKITDFGLARAADDASLTQSGVLAGTPQYMAPEQAMGKALDHRADLFSLGSVLHAMCTGRPPFRAATPLAVLRRICEEEPHPVRDINPEVSTLLEEMIQVLHAKDPRDRLQSGIEVSELLGQHLAHLQHPARVPLPRLPRGRRKAPPRMPFRRSLAAGILLLALGGVLALARSGVLSSWFGQRAPGLAYKVSPSLVEAGKEKARAVLSFRLRADLEHGAFPVFGAAFAPGSELLAVASADASVRLWDPSRELLETRLQGHRQPIWAVAFSPDGQYLASAAGDWRNPQGTGEVKLWCPSTRKELFTLEGHNALVLCVAFSPDSKLLATGSWDRTVRLWDPAGGKSLHVLAGHGVPVRSLAFSPDGKTLFAGCLDGTIKIWNVETREDRGVLQAMPPEDYRLWINSLTVSPDGRTLAVAENLVPIPSGLEKEKLAPREYKRLGQVRLWDIANKQSGTVLRGYRGMVLSVAFSPDGTTLVSGGGRTSQFGEVKVWDLPAGTERLNLLGHSQWVECVAFSPGNRLLVTAGGTAEKGGEVKLWDVYSGLPTPGAPQPPPISVLPPPLPGAENAPPIRGAQAPDDRFWAIMPAAMALGPAPAPTLTPFQL
jgi:hypothetical protein